jgi:hypothetical protein
MQSVQFQYLGTELDIGAERNKISTSVRTNSNVVSRPPPSPPHERNESGSEIVQRE